MEKNSNDLYEQVYLFFLKKSANDIVFQYINKGMNLIFNSDSLLVTSINDSYVITVINKNKKNIGIYIPIKIVIIIIYYVEMVI